MSLPIKAGRIKLSTKLIITVAAAKTIACQILPTTNIIIAAIPRTNEGPTAGIIAIITMITPQMKAPLTPVNQNTKPPKVPCIVPTNRVLLMSP